MKMDFLDLQRAWVVPRKKPAQVNKLTWILLFFVGVEAGIVYLLFW